MAVWGFARLQSEAEEDMEPTALAVVVLAAAAMVNAVATAPTTRGLAHHYSHTNHPLTTLTAEHPPTHKATQGKPHRTT